MREYELGVDQNWGHFRPNGPTNLVMSSFIHHPLLEALTHSGHPLLPLLETSAAGFTRLDIVNHRGSPRIIALLEVRMEP